MQIIEQVLKLFMTTDSEKYSDLEIHKLLLKTVSPTVKQYKKSNKQHQSLFQKDENIDRLIVLRCFAFELWNSIIQGKLHNEIYGRRINVIETALLRCEIATDENIALFTNGYGLSAMSNLRLMLEAFSISKYLWKKGENEAKRFQDYREYQKSEFDGTKADIEDKHDESFYKPYGWISEPELRSLSHLVKELKNAKYDELFKISNNYVHATPYSLEKVWELNHKRMGYFPIDLSELIRLNEFILTDFLCFVVDRFVESDEKDFYKLFLKIIVDRM
ncbi:MAG: hypothetical protein IJJ71_13355 [Treponema sp.]|uniref:DUF5677 domain-containing protein n=1 Tax=Treponema sp. TaxID=166 RepID=UPI0026006527|nr:DUF5677 domain-containing protein [Treponema sp.]MBQ3642489.1 hypothetical protein [bacterium]MBQ6057294.1 hypothetical protein [Treponema sp.]MBR0497144.1 hypothetical protein [Treponema sp.]